MSLFSDFKKELTTQINIGATSGNASVALKQRLRKRRFNSLLKSDEIKLFNKIVNSAPTKQYFHQKVISSIDPNNHLLENCGYLNHTKDKTIQHYLILFEILVFSSNNPPNNNFIAENLNTWNQNLNSLNNDLKKLIAKNNKKPGIEDFVRELIVKQQDIEFGISYLEEQNTTTKSIGGHARTMEQTLFIRYLVKNFQAIYGKKHEYFAATIFDIKFDTAYTDKTNELHWDWVTQACRGKKLDRIPSLLSN